MNNRTEEMEVKKDKYVYSLNQSHSYSIYYSIALFKDVATKWILVNRVYIYKLFLRVVIAFIYEINCNYRDLIGNYSCG